MRRLLLASAGLLALTEAAQAQIPVTDAGVLGQTVQEVKQGIQQLQYWEQQIQFMESQLQQLMAVYNTLSHVTDLASAVRAPVPCKAYSIRSPDCSTRTLPIHMSIRRPGHRLSPRR